MGKAPVQDAEWSLALALADAQASVLRVVCGLGFVNAMLLLLLTVAAPTAFGLVAAAGWVAIWALLAASAMAVREWLTYRPASLIAFAVAGVVPMGFDGGLEGTLTTQAVWLTWVAAVTVSARMTLMTAGAMSLGMVPALLISGMGVHDLVGGHDRFQATLLICTPLLAALLALALVGVFRDVLTGALDTLDAVAAGAPASTPGLGRLLHRDAPRLLSPGTGAASGANGHLTTSEAEVVALLRGGRTPQQIALERGRSIHTIRTQIKHAKRKVGARTINELIARTWPAS